MTTIRPKVVARRRLGCTAYANALSNLSMLNDRDTAFALISRDKPQ
jgi:hypothetical protein